MATTAGGITEFLNELSETDALTALKGAYSNRSPFIFKVEGTEQPIKAFINAFSDKKVIIIPEPAVSLPIDKETSIKFLVGTEVFFIKTIFKSHLNRFYIDMDTKVIQLKRRKEPRLLIPKNWNQSGVVILPKATQTLKCNVIDISKSGIRFELLEQPKIPFHRDDVVKIKFQIHKRGEVSTTAIVRFSLNRANANGLLGLEFAEISEVQIERVGSIVNDILMYTATSKS